MKGRAAILASTLPAILAIAVLAAGLAGYVFGRAFFVVS